MIRPRAIRIVLASFLVMLFWLAPGARQLSAQSAFATDPAAALADAFLAACRQDSAVFATHLTVQSSAAYLALPNEQRIDLLKRFVLLDDPGKPLLTTDGQGHNVIRCEAGGVLSELRFGVTQVHDNLAFIPVTLPQADEQEQSASFGLVREDGKWKLLSLGLLLLDVPSLARQWVQQDMEARESRAAQSLRKISEALSTYVQAFGSLPEMLAQLGPPDAGDQGKSPGWKPDCSMQISLAANTVATASGTAFWRSLGVPRDSTGNTSRRFPTSPHDSHPIWESDGERDPFTWTPTEHCAAAIRAGPWPPPMIQSLVLRNPSNASRYTARKADPRGYSGSSYSAHVRNLPLPSR